MTKKQLGIIIGVIALITLGLLIAAYFIGKKESGGAEEGEGTGLGKLFPFGKTGNENSLREGTPYDENKPSDLVSVPFRPFVQITSIPTAGMYLFSKNGEDYVQYAERATGHIYELALDDLTRARISQVTTPRVHEAWWMSTGTSVIFRYLRDDGNTIATLVTKTPKSSITEEATSTESSGKFLSDNIADMISSPDGKKLFFTLVNEDKSLLSGFTWDEAGSKAKQVYSSEFTEWLPVAFDGKTVWLQSKAGYNIPGVLYKLDTLSGSSERVLGDIKGLDALPSSDGKFVLYSEGTRGLFDTFLYDTVKGTKVNFPIKTLPEKCVWKRNIAYCLVPENPRTSKYPDKWYQGLISFQDKLWKINAETLETSILFDPLAEKERIEVDGVRPMILGDGEVVVFLNKKDSTLWAYREPKLP